MALKYDLNITSVGSGNIVTDGFVWLNTQLSGLLVYGLIIMLTIIAVFVFLKSTDDISLSLVRGLFMAVILGIIFYYWGLTIGYTLFSGVILLGMILILAASGGVIYYARNKIGGD